MTAQISVTPLEEINLPNKHYTYYTERTFLIEKSGNNYSQ